MGIGFINYLLASIISYLGLLIGVILIKMAPEEQKHGKKHFILLKKILFFIIFIPILYFYGINIIFSLALLFFIVALMVSNKIRLDKTSSVYMLLGILFAVSRKFIDLFAIESVLILLYGVPTASLMLSIKKKNYYGIFIKNLWFFIPAVTLYFIF